MKNNNMMMPFRFSRDESDTEEYDDTSYRVREENYTRPRREQPPNIPKVDGTSTIMTETLCK